MALGTIGAALATAAISAGGSIAASKLSGSSRRNRQAQQRVQSFQPAGFTGGGLQGRFEGGNFNVTGDPARAGLVSNIGRLSGEQAGLVRGLRGQVEPGIGRLTTSRLAQIEDARKRSIGNLRENLSRRRILGSSFGEDALLRGEAEFARESERVEAESFLQELDLKNQLIQQEFDLRRNEFQTGLNELNLQAEVGAKLQSGITSVLAQNARFQQEQAAKEAAGAGKFFGQQIQPIAQAVGAAVGGGGSGGGLFGGQNRTTGIRNIGLSQVPASGLPQLSTLR